MKNYLFEGMDKFISRYREEDNPKKKLKESFDEEEFEIKDYLPDTKDIIKFFVAGTTREKVEGAKKVLDAMKDEIMETGTNDLEFYKDDQNIKEFIYDMQDNTGEFSHLLGDDEDLDESYLEEETNMDKINKYLKSIGESPITEDMTNWGKISKELDRRPNTGFSNWDKIERTIDNYKNSGSSNWDKIDKLLKKQAKPVTESIKEGFKPMNLFESMNRGFEKLYGKIDDIELEDKYAPVRKSLNESCKKNKKPLKESTDETVTVKDIDKFLKAKDKEIKKLVRYIVRHDLQDDATLYDSIGDMAYDYFDSFNTPEADKYLTSKIDEMVAKEEKLQESINKKPLKEYKNKLKENYEEAPKIISDFLSNPGKDSLLLIGDEEEYGTHLSTILLNTARKKGYETFDLNSMDFDLNSVDFGRKFKSKTQERLFSSPKVVGFIDGYLQKRNVSYIFDLLENPEFKGKIVVIEYPDHPLDISLKTRLRKAKLKENYEEDLTYDSAYDMFIDALDKELGYAMKDELEYQDGLDSRADDAAILGYAMKDVFYRLPINVQRKLVRNPDNVDYPDMLFILKRKDFNSYMDLYF